MFLCICCSLYILLEGSSVCPIPYINNKCNTIITKAATAAKEIHLLFNSDPPDMRNRNIIHKMLIFVTCMQHINTTIISQYKVYFNQLRITIYDINFHSEFDLFRRIFSEEKGIPPSTHPVVCGTPLPYCNIYIPSIYTSDEAAFLTAF